VARTDLELETEVNEGSIYTILGRSVRISLPHLSKDIKLDHPHPIKYDTSPGVLFAPRGGNPCNGCILTGQDGTFISLDEMANFLLLRMLGKSPGSCLVYEYLRSLPK
jgi:hypothetical protein